MVRIRFLTAAVPKIFQSGDIKSRPNGSSGFWLYGLLPIAIIAYGLKHATESSATYRLCCLLSLEMLFTSLTCLSKCYKGQHSNHSIKWHLITAVFITGLYPICLHTGLLFSLYSGLIGTIFYCKFYTFILKCMPYSFTLGEAAVVSQAIMLVTYSTTISIYNALYNIPTTTSDIITIVIQIGLTAVGFTCFILYRFKSLRQPSKFYTTSGSVIIIFLIILHVILRRSAILWIVYFIIDDATKLRIIAYWSICSILAVLVIRKRIVEGRKASTGIRKVFHVLAVAVYLPGMLYQCNLLYLGSGVVLGIFAFLEMLRVLNIPPLGNSLQDGFIIFCDEKDAGPIALTPIYLLVGCSLPIWLHPAPCDITDSSGFNTCQLLSGVLSIGIGDTMAAIVGSRIGKHKWTGSLKTVEGTISCVLSQLTVVSALIYFGFLMIYQQTLFQIVMAIIIASLTEALTTQIDNLVLPLLTFIMLV